MVDLKVEGEDFGFKPEVWMHELAGWTFRLYDIVRKETPGSYLGTYLENTWRVVRFRTSWWHRESLVIVLG